MQVDIRYKPAFATIFVTLMTGESIVAESDAMASMSSETKMRTRFNGGFFRAILKRFFGGESLFVNEFFCPAGVDQVQLVLTQPLPGDIQQVNLQGQTLFIQPGGFIACSPGVQLGMGWAGFASWIGGEGLFRLKVSGHGAVWFGGYGSVFAREIGGEYVVDTGHLIAYEPTVSLHVGMSGGIFSTIFGGEGLITRVRGQGQIYMQSRSLEGLASWTNGHL
ncbi:MAG: TIGR00266 family protein [Myxococcales bacterium]|nr:TIGR00266 family protein [Myxococcales bacterium]